MTPKEVLESEREAIRKQLRTVVLPINNESALCGAIGYSLGVSGVTVKNYLDGNIPDGLLAMHIYKEFKRLKYVKFK